MSIKVLVNGANGKMGQYTVNAVSSDPDLELVATTVRQDNLAEIIQKTQAQVVVDFTTASVGYAIAETIIEAGAHPVIGTSGFTESHVKSLQTLCENKKLGGIIAPNFSIGAVLMMKYAADASKYFPHVEIIEMHHENKQDAPSGTAIKTSEMIAKERCQLPKNKNEKELIAGVRGGKNQEINIHSVRLPGFMAHQQVIFGNPGETLTIRHDSLDRSCFMAGVLLACKKVMSLNALIYGLEHLL